MAEPNVIITGGPLSIAEVERVARRDAKVEISPEAIERMQAARDVVDQAARGRKPVYGINTGFGSFANIKINGNELRDLQRNLVRSHSAGVGEPLPAHVVRAMMAILAASLARGHSGCRVDVAELLVAMVNGDVVPVIPARGSVGASGDLAPLAHLALALIGEGEVFSTKPPHRRSGKEALASVGLKPLTLEAKEGLSLINGTHLMCAEAAIALSQIDDLWNAALAAAAMAIDACLATDQFLDERIHHARGQVGQQNVGERLRSLLANSQIFPSHKENDPRVQDPYCLRAMPQVLGAAMDAIDYARTIVERELGAVTDNPLVFPASPTAILSGGNFHGMPLAVAMDTMKIALTHIAGIAERRINWVLSGTDKHNPVPSFLSPKPGLHSGYMIVQYTAAACVNEMVTLAMPASVGNITTSAGMEDYNSMGATSARQLRASVELATNVVAIELLVMAEAIEHHRPLKSGDGVERAHAAVRKQVARLTEDRPPAPDIETLCRLIVEGAFTELAGFAKQRSA